MLMKLTKKKTFKGKIYMFISIFSDLELEKNKNDYGGS